MKLKYYDNCGIPERFQHPAPQRRRELAIMVSEARMHVEKGGSEAADAYAYLGSLCTSLYRPRFALLFLRKALKLDPQNQTARFALGAYYVRSGEDEKAFEIFDKLVSERTAMSCPEALSEALSMRGVARSGLGQPRNALEDFKSAVLANPINASALRNAGEMLIIDGNLDEALLYLMAANRVNPKCDTLQRETALIMASVLDTLGDKEGSEKLLSLVRFSAVNKYYLFENGKIDLSVKDASA